MAAAYTLKKELKKSGRKVRSHTTARPVRCRSMRPPSPTWRVPSGSLWQSGTRSPPAPPCCVRPLTQTHTPTQNTQKNSKKKKTVREREGERGRNHIVSLNKSLLLPQIEKRRSEKKKEKKNTHET